MDIKNIYEDLGIDKETFEKSKQNPSKRGESYYDKKTLQNIIYNINEYIKSNNLDVTNIIFKQNTNKSELIEEIDQFLKIFSMIEEGINPENISSLLYIKSYLESELEDYNDFIEEYFDLLTDVSIKNNITNEIFIPLIKLRDEQLEIIEEIKNGNYNFESELSIGDELELLFDNFKNDIKLTLQGIIEHYNLKVDFIEQEDTEYVFTDMSSSEDTQDSKLLQMFDGLKNQLQNSIHEIHKSMNHLKENYQDNYLENELDQIYKSLNVLKRDMDKFKSIL